MARKRIRSGAKTDALASTLSTARTTSTSFDAAWAGLEPTFSDAKAVKKWAKLAEVEGGEDRYFEDKYMLRTMRHVARSIEKQYRARLKKGDAACPFDAVGLERDVDQWKVERQNLAFSWKDFPDQRFEVRFGLDPETFEYSIKPVPIAWLYDERFVRFLEDFVWAAPQRLGLAPSMAHGGGQFSLSAKTFMQGSLLADDVASRLDHPELSTWISDYPNPDDRAFRATRRRLRAFQRALDAYWKGGFHPRAIGVLTVANAYLDRGFGPAREGVAAAMDEKRGPVGSAREVFQTNFAFGRAVRLQAQAVDPGYWQAQHPDEDGYRPDQIMRYSEGNLNRLQIAGELHVKSGKVLDRDEVPELDSPLEIEMLYDEASWEIRAQMSRASASDFVEALLLEVHHARWLLEHPHVRVRESLLQDQLMVEGVETLARTAPKVLAKLRKAARRANLESSNGRMKTDWIEPETLFWAAWKHLSDGERAEIAEEVVIGFLERVHRAATKDPRAKQGDDAMEPHRHRIHPLIWRALEKERGVVDKNAEVRAEWTAWRKAREKYLARRPAWSVTGARPPWK